MTNPFMMPPTGFGPGSQPLDHNDEKLEYMPLPQDMRTYSPSLPEIDELEPDQIGPAMALLGQVAAACVEVAETGGMQTFDLRGFDAANRTLIAETLGEGEVSAKVRAVPAIALQESVFAGVWCAKGDGIDRIEVAAIPPCVHEDAFAVHKPGLGNATPLAAGVVNAPPLLIELHDKSKGFRIDAPLHVVNMSLLPHTEEDLLWLDQALGEGAVTILSRGYGNCRITSTTVPHVWRVQFFNSMDTLILDTFEVTTVPEVALAADEDLVDSGARILSVLEAIQ